MQMPADYCDPETLKALRDDFDFAHLLISTAIRRGLGNFTFAGLRKPLILQKCDVEPTQPIGPDSALELVLFEDHLYDRVVALAQNRRMTREIWAISEVSRPFREAEFSEGNGSALIARHITDLVAALCARSQEHSLAALSQSTAWYKARIEARLAKLDQTPRGPRTES